MATSSGCSRTDECRPLAGAPSVVATPSIGSPTTSMSGWPVPRRTVRRILLPLSFDWDGEALLVATPTASPSGRNLATTRTVRLGLGHTRDVSMIMAKSRSSRSTRCRSSGVTGSPRAPASTRVRWPRRTAGSGRGPPAVSGAAPHVTCRSHLLSLTCASRPGRPCTAPRPRPARTRRDTPRAQPSRPRSGRPGPRRCRRTP